MELIKGKWYSHENNGSYFYFRFNRLENNNLYCSNNFINFIKDFIILPGKTETVIFNCNDLNIHYIDFSKIVKYLPENDLDKITYLRKKKIEWLLKN